MIRSSSAPGHQDQGCRCCGDDCGAGSGTCGSQIRLEYVRASGDTGGS